MVMKESRHIFHIHGEISASRFEGENFLTPLDYGDPKLFAGPFRFNHIAWVLSSQGDFLSCHYKTQKSIMCADGPLPRPWRHYIAMMAAACLGCEYLARSELEQFLTTGGDSAWLTNPESAIPKKLKCLCVLNRLMAHKPYALDSSSIGNVVSEGRWSASELAHAIVILATFHSLPSLVYGSGVRIEDDLALTEEVSRNVFFDPLVESEPEWDETASLPRCFSFTDTPPCLIQRLLHSSERSTSIEEPISAFEGFGALNSGCASPVAMPVASSTKVPKLGEDDKHALASIMAAQPKWRSILCKSLMTDPEGPLEYKDFVQKSDSILHTSSFSWEDHGTIVLSRQMPEATESINEEHAHALEFTTNSIGDKCIESTATVREAIVKYVQRMYGVFHDDYRYNKLNKILPVIHKAYLKKLACYPERLTKVDYWRMRKFECFSSIDLIHYAHLVSQTKRIVELTWAMKAFTSFYQSPDS